jgi:hypothetical protein
VSDNDSERDGEEGDNDSDNDLEIVGEQSGTADSAGDASGEKTRGGQGIRSHHCCSCYGLLETDNPRPERGSAGANEDSASFQPAANHSRKGRIARSRTHSTCLIGGSRTVQRYTNSRHGFRNRLKCHLLQSNRHGFRNRLKCHLLQSIILSLSLIAVNVIDYHFHLLQ